MKYQQVYDGEWIQPTRRGHRMACCDCGLVHRIDFRVRSKRVQFRAVRDAQATRRRRQRRSATKVT